MVDVIAAALVLAGLVLLFAGAALSVYGVALLGALLGGGGGYLVAPTIAAAVGAEGILAIAIAVVVGAIAGVVIAYSVLSFAIGAVSFVVGIYVGTIVAPLLFDGAWYVEWGVALGIGIAAAVLAAFMTKTALMLVTSVFGAALASRSLTAEGIRTAQETGSVAPLTFDLTAPLFLGLFVLGVLAQLGLFKFGYVAKLTALLPGASVLRDRREKERA